MIQRTLPLVLALTLLISAQAVSVSPLTPAEALESFETGIGNTVDLVASEPLVESPCAMAFDERGLLYIAENRGYPHGPKEGEPPVGRIALLRDLNRDQQMDSRVTFADGLTFPNGVMPWRDGLIVTCAPDVLFLRDTDGDGRADERRVLLTGFDTAKSTQLRVNAPLLGPDGWIWLASGLSGGKISNPEHPEYGTLDLKTDVRFHPESGRFEAVDGRSQFGHSFDDFGQRFICMNRIQVQHVVMPSSALERNPLLAFSDTVQNCPEIIPNALLRGGGGAARIFPISKNVTTADSHAGTFSAACAVTIRASSAFSCEPTGNLIHEDQLMRIGGTFAAMPRRGEKEFLASRDDWFRPVFLAGGPDGALYVCDMYRKVIEHPDYLPEEVRKHTDMEAGKDMGRIWRIRNKAHVSGQVRFEDSVAPESLLSHLDSGNEWERQTAFRLLVQRVGELTPQILEAAAGKAQTSPAQAAILMLADQTNSMSKRLTADAMSDRDPSVRALTIRLAPSKIPLDMLMDPDPHVRFHSALVLGTFAGDGTTTALAEIARKDGGDRWTRAAILSSAANAEEALTRALIRENYVPDLTLLRDLGRIIGRRTQGPARGEQLDALLRESERQPSVGVALAAGFADSPSGLPESPAVSSVLQQSVNLAGDAAQPTARVLAIELLGSAKLEVSKAPLLAALESGELELQLAAARSLARVPEPEAAETLIKPDGWPSYAPAVRDTILSALSSRPPTIKVLLAAVEKQELPANAIDTLRRQQWMKHSDPDIRERATKLFAQPSDTTQQQALAEAKQSLTLAPVSSNGREVFGRLCASCHRFERAGHPVGPDLFDIRNQSKENILLHLVAPEHEIAPGFAAYMLEFKDGRMLAGVIASETADSITLRQPGGLEETIPRAGVATLTASPTSLMPPGLQRAMTPQELADLLSYLRGEQ